MPDAPANGDDYYRIMGVKLWHDGSPYTGTMVLSEPYLNNDLTTKMGIADYHKGESRLTASEFANQVKTYSLNGWQLAVHSQGDQSNIDALEGFESV